MGISLMRRVDRPRVAFLHVPKCGGTSLDAALRRGYGLRARLNARTVHLDIRPMRCAAEYTESKQKDVAQHLLIYHMCRERTLYVSGHVRYGPAIEAVRQSWRLVTLLRDPVERFLSQYFYAQREGALDPVQEPLERFLETERARQWGHFYPGFFGSGCVEEAKRVLRSFDVVGHLEDTPTLERAFRRLGLRIRLGHRNKGQLRQDVSAHLRRRIERLCAPSMEVYEAIFGISGAREGSGRRL